MVDVLGRSIQTLMEELFQSVSSQVKVQHDATGLQPAASPSLTVYSLWSVWSILLLWHHFLSQAFPECIFFSPSWPSIQTIAMFLSDWPFPKWRPDCTNLKTPAYCYHCVTICVWGLEAVWEQSEAKQLSVNFLFDYSFLNVDIRPNDKAQLLSFTCINVDKWCLEHKIVISSVGFVCPASHQM